MHEYRDHLSLRPRWSLGSKVFLIVVIALGGLPHITRAASFSVGSISTTPVNETKKFSRFATYLAQQLKTDGIDEGKVVVAESISAMSALMRSGQVDLYIDSLFPSFAVSRLSGSKLLVRRWKSGKSEYRSIIFTRNDSSMSRPDDLRGKMIAFEEPFSSSGYFFPKVELSRMKIQLVPKRQASESVGTNKVGYIFSHADTNTIFMVLNGATAAGAIDSDKYFTFASNHGSLKILHETIPFPRQIVSCRADLSAKLMTKVKNILLGLHRSEEGRSVLQEFENTSQFDEIPVPAIDLMTALRKYIEAEIQRQ